MFMENVLGTTVRILLDLDFIVSDTSSSRYSLLPDGDLYRMSQPQAAIHDLGAKSTGDQMCSFISVFFCYGQYKMIEMVFSSDDGVSVLIDNLY